MFEFGKDLRKLFAQARQDDDLGWVELIGADLLRIEARQQSTDAGRVSCPRPFPPASSLCPLALLSHPTFASCLAAFH